MDAVIVWEAFDEILLLDEVTGGKVHDAVQTFFDKEGYETDRDSKQPSGFFHALGHGVGLETDHAL